MNFWLLSNNVHKILIANRGDVALRVLRACKEMGILGVIVHSTADADSMPVRLADESVCIGPTEQALSHLFPLDSGCGSQYNGADAVHPGVGFLSENADFAEIVKAVADRWSRNTAYPVNGRQG